MRNYYIGKQQARQKAIEYQIEIMDKIMSWGELVAWTELFYKLGKRFGLIKEFKENWVL